MIRVGLTELRRHFGEYMRRLKAGEIIVITERGKEIAWITPIRKTVEERTKPLTVSD
jgi:prevent-host-death family protein